MMLMHRIILLSTVRSGLSIALLLLGLLLLVFVFILKKIANVLLIYGFRGLLQRENRLCVTIERFFLFCINNNKLSLLLLLLTCKCSNINILVFIIIFIIIFICFFDNFIKKISINAKES